MRLGHSDPQLCISQSVLCVLQSICHGIRLCRLGREARVPGAHVTRQRLFSSFFRRKTGIQLRTSQGHKCNSHKSFIQSFGLIMMRPGCASQLSKCLLYLIHWRYHPSDVTGLFQWWPNHLQGTFLRPLQVPDAEPKPTRACHGFRIHCPCPQRSPMETIWRKRQGDAVDTGCGGSHDGSSDPQYPH